MIAEILPWAYDTEGRPVSHIDLRRKNKGTHSTYPFGRYFSHPLTVNCKDLDEVRQFLARCRAVSDKEQFGREEYFQPPDQFEQTRRGDCDDFALWTWRQLFDLGYETRFVVGTFGIVPEGHAWVAFRRDSDWYLVEPGFRFLASWFPRLTTTRYEPKFSVTWDGKNPHFFQHKKPERAPAFLRLIPLALEWIGFWIYGSAWIVVHLPRRIINLIRRRRTRLAA